MSLIFLLYYHVFDFDFDTWRTPTSSHYPFWFIFTWITSLLLLRIVTFAIFYVSFSHCLLVCSVVSLLLILLCYYFSLARVICLFFCLASLLDNDHNCFSFLFVCLFRKKKMVHTFSDSQLGSWDLIWPRYSPSLVKLVLCLLPTVLVLVVAVALEESELEDGKVLDEFSGVDGCCSSIQLLLRCRMASPWL